MLTAEAGSVAPGYGYRWTFVIAPAVNVITK
jgi:hypothetical protein